MTTPLRKGTRQFRLLAGWLSLLLALPSSAFALRPQAESESAGLEELDRALRDPKDPFRATATLVSSRLHSALGLPPIEPAPAAGLEEAWKLLTPEILRWLPIGTKVRHTSGEIYQTSSAPDETKGFMTRLLRKSEAGLAESTAPLASGAWEHLESSFAGKAIYRSEPEYAWRSHLHELGKSKEGVPIPMQSGEVGILIAPGYYRILLRVEEGGVLVLPQESFTLHTDIYLREKLDMEVQVDHSVWQSATQKEAVRVNLIGSGQFEVSRTEDGLTFNPLEPREEDLRFTFTRLLPRPSTGPAAGLEEDEGYGIELGGASRVYADLLANARSWSNVDFLDYQRLAEFVDTAATGTRLVGTAGVSVFLGMEPRRFLVSLEPGAFDESALVPYLKHVLRGEGGDIFAEGHEGPTLSVTDLDAPQPFSKRVRLSALGRYESGQLVFSVEAGDAHGLAAVGPALLAVIARFIHKSPAAGLEEDKGLSVDESEQAGEPVSGFAGRQLTLEEVLLALSRFKPDLVEIAQGMAPGQDPILGGDILMPDERGQWGEKDATHFRNKLRHMIPQGSWGQPSFDVVIQRQFWNRYGTPLQGLNAPYWIASVGLFLPGSGRTAAGLEEYQEAFNRLMQDGGFRRELSEKGWVALDGTQLDTFGEPMVWGMIVSESADLQEGDHAVIADEELINGAAEQVLPWVEAGSGPEQVIRNARTMQARPGDLILIKAEPGVNRVVVTRLLKTVGLTRDRAVRAAIGTDSQVLALPLATFQILASSRDAGPQVIRLDVVVRLRDEAGNTYKLLLMV